MGLWSPLEGSKSDYSGQYNDYHYSTVHAKKRLDLLDLLHQFRSKRCTNPRDRVFSLLSLCTTEDRASVPVDYDMSLRRLAYLILSFRRERLCLCAVTSVLLALTPERRFTDGGPWIEFDVGTNTQLDVSAPTTILEAQELDSDIRDCMFGPNVPQCGLEDLLLILTTDINLIYVNPITTRNHGWLIVRGNGRATVRVALEEAGSLKASSIEKACPKRDVGCIRLGWGVTPSAAKRVFIRAAYRPSPGYEYKSYNG